MSNVIDIQGRFPIHPKIFRKEVIGEGRKSADTGIVVDLAVKMASADRLSRDVKTCEDAISLLEVTIDAAGRITDLVGEMTGHVSSDADGGDSGVGPGADVLSGLRDMRSECGSIASEADYMGLSLIGPAGPRKLKPGLNSVGGGDIILSFLSPLSNGNCTHCIEARDLSPGAIGIPHFRRRETGALGALLGAHGLAMRARDYFRLQSENLKSFCLGFNGRWEKSLGQAHRISGSEAALDAIRFLDARITRSGRISGSSHDHDRLRSRLLADRRA
jgi:hypothetical protein